MTIVYQLREDKQNIEAVQRATQTTRKFGIMRTDGLFGSEQWWHNIETGKLPIHKITGAIVQIYMGGMRDTPEFVLRSDTGEESTWLRQANSKELNNVYAIGCLVEIDYVLQRHRLLSDLGPLKRHKIVIEIRLGMGEASKGTVNLASSGTGK
jgi:hypothetical protein